VKPQLRWECPNGCPAVLGPRRPKSDNVCRYCLRCSTMGKFLVRRTSPTVEKSRSKRIVDHRDKLAAKRVREQERKAAYYTFEGVNLYDKMIEFTRLPVFKDNPIGDRVPIYIYPPRLRLRRCSKKPRSRLGFCRYNGNGSSIRSHISISVWPEATLTSLLETLLHEVVHAHVGTSPFRHNRHHGPRFKAILRAACEEAFGVRPRVHTRFVGEVERLLEEREKSAASEQSNSQNEGES
jgi:hypothetical protein